MNDVERERREAELGAAKDALIQFMKSPQAKHVSEYIRLALQCYPLMANTPEQTAYRVGAYEVTLLLDEMRGRNNG